MKNIHVLPTDKPSRLIMYSKLLGTFRLLDEPCDDWKGRLNTYITNDEEIKEGDYGVLGESILSYHQMHKKWGMPQGKKIILTTDQDLIKDGVQAIDDDFLEWFIKNPSCEFVKVKSYIKTYEDGSTFDRMDYEIIIPKEESCEHFTPTIGCIKDVCSCNKDPKQAPFKHKVESLSTEEVLANRSDAYEFIDFDKQETLEEASTNYANKNFSTKDPVADEGWYASWLGFRNGAKWQQEQILDFLHSEITERRDYSASKMCYKVIEFIENIKKK